MYTSKTAVVDAVKSFGIIAGVPFDQICVGGGAAMVLMGLRESTQDLNLWVDSPWFDNLAERMKVCNHPMVDTVVQHGNEWVRERNRYFPHVMIEGIQVFNPLTLLVLKRGGYQDVRRPLAKRQQDHRDIKLIDELLAESNKVKDPIAAE